MFSLLERQLYRMKGQPKAPTCWPLLHPIMPLGSEGHFALLELFLVSMCPQIYDGAYFALKVFLSFLAELEVESANPLTFRTDTFRCWPAATHLN